MAIGEGEELLIPAIAFPRTLWKLIIYRAWRHGFLLIPSISRNTKLVTVLYLTRGIKLFQYRPN